MRLRADYDPRAFHPQGTSLVELTRLQESVWGPDDQTALVAVDDPDLLTAAGLARVDALTRTLAAESGIERVLSITNAQEIRGDGDTLEVAAFLSPLPTQDKDAQVAGRRLLADPAIAGVLLSKTGTSTLLQVTVLESWSAPKKRADLHDRIAAQLEHMKQTTHLGGFPMVRVQYPREMLGETTRLLGTTLVLLLVLLAFGLRSLRDALSTLLVVVIATVWTHGIMQLCGDSFSILGTLTPIVIVVVGTADAIHVILAYRRTGSREAAIRETLVPTLITSVTTAIGFLALLSARDVAMVRDYGVYTALGVLMAWAATMLVLPVCLRGTGKDALAGSQWADRWLDRLMAAPKRALLITLATTAVAAGLATQISTDARILDGLPDDHPIMGTYRLLERDFGGSLPMAVVYDADSPERLSQPDVFNHIQGTAEALRAEPDVGMVADPATIVARFQRAMMGGADQHEVIPQDAGGLADVLMGAELSDPNPLAGLVSETDGVARIRVLMAEKGSANTIAVQERLMEELARRPLEGVAVGLSGTAYVAPRAWRILQTRMAEGLGWAVLLITVLFGVLFRSPTLAILSMIPNLLPLLAVLAVMALVGIPAKGNNAVVFSIAYGIAVDDTIHLLSNLYRHHRMGTPWIGAIKKAHRDVRGALVLTSVVFAGGFAVLMTSTFEFNVTLGVQMVVATSVALAADLVLLPALLVLVRKPR